jgi:serine/threonine protein kinase
MSESDHQTPFEAPSPEEVANLFPTYDVHRLIACGGMGAVFHATQRSLDRAVAIKILPREFSQDEEFRVGFEAEAKAMAKLNHPNLIGVYDFGEVDGMLYIVMEYVEGNSVHEAANGQAIEQTTALKIVIDTCHGLAHAHEAQILHRDIKPSNILLDANLVPKVADFGLARALENQIEEGEQIFGTPGYTAPEVIEPPYTFDHRADIFSVGVMLHELLTGITPDGDKPVSSQIRVSHPKLAAIIRRAVNPDPEKRYNSAEDLAADLAKIASKPVNPLLSSASGQAAGKSYTPPKPIKKKSSGGKFFLLLILVGGGAYFFFKSDDQKKTVETPQDREETVKKDISVKETTPDKPVPEITTEGENVTPEPEVTEADDTQDEEIPLVRKTAAEEGLNPKYDVEGLFEKAEEVMSDRIAPYRNAFYEKIKANTVAYGNSLASVFSRFSDEARGSAAATLAESLDNWAQNRYLLPEEPAPQLMLYPEVKSSYPAALTRQEELRKQLTEKIDSEAAFYIKGIEMRIEKLKAENDADAVTLLEKEIARVKADPAYFRSVVVEKD